MAEKRYDEQSYIYASARIRAILAKEIGTEQVLRAANAQNFTEAVRILEEGGLHFSEDGAESSFNDMLENTFRIAVQTAPDPEILNLLRYPYDCHNIKSMIKASFAHTSASHLWMPGGTVPQTVMTQQLHERHYDRLPLHMGKAAEEAYDVYARTQDPQQIDFLLDRACFSDMLALAEQYPEIPYLRQLVAIKADITNLQIAIRLGRMQKNAMQQSLFLQIKVPGGELPDQLFAEALSADSGGEELLFSNLRKTEYGKIALSEDMTLTAIERNCESYYLQYVEEQAKSVLYGIQTLYAFIIMREALIRNVRIVLSGKAAFLPSQIIRQRLRG